MSSSNLSFMWVIAVAFALTAVSAVLYLRGEVDQLTVQADLPAIAALPVRAQ